MKADFQKLLEIYDLEIRNNCRNKRKVYVFERNKMQNIYNICNLLNEKKYFPGKYNIFIIRDPKYRIVMSLSIRDKLVNHYFARCILLPKLEKYLNVRNVATRKGYGIDYGIKLVKKYLEQNKKYDNFYILKIDIKKYFYNIDHDVLKSLLKDKLTEDEFLILERIIDSTDSDYINESINQRVLEEIKRQPKNEAKINDLPRYQKGKGLSLGAMTSQFLSIFYLYKLDNFIIHKLHLKYMVHYMDDIIIMHHDKKYLYEALEKIESMLRDFFKLELNQKKTKIVSIHEGFSFLGYRFLIRNKKTIMKIKKDTLKRIKRRIKEVEYLYRKGDIEFEKVFCSINTYLYSFKYASNLKVIKIVDKYYFQKWVS